MTAFLPLHFPLSSPCSSHISLYNDSAATATSHHVSVLGLAPGRRSHEIPPRLLRPETKVTKANWKLLTMDAGLHRGLPLGSLVAGTDTSFLLPVTREFLVNGANLFLHVHRLRVQRLWTGFWLRFRRGEGSPLSPP